MHELSVSLFIDAPTARVWDVMVNRLEEWFCPSPWTARIVEQDRRPGGTDRMVFHGPEGEEMPQEGIFLAWEEGRMFATTDAITGALEPAGPFMIGIWEVVPEGSGTRYTARARHWTEEAMQQHAEMGFESGWMAAAQQLKVLAEGA